MRIASNQDFKFHDALASVSTATASDLTSVALQTFYPVDKIVVFFGEHSTQPTNKRSRQCRIDDENIDLALAALKVVRALRIIKLPSELSTKLSTPTRIPTTQHSQEN